MGPNDLTVYGQTSPNGNWNSFRNHNGGVSYRNLRNLIFSTQGGLCAYCEANVSERPESRKRIEHFHPKSDQSNHLINWSLDWGNVFGVCIGGDDSNKTAHPRPKNLSCDSHKNHLASSDSSLEKPEGNVLNPLDMVVGPCLFSLNRATGELEADENACRSVTLPENNYSSTYELVSSTIKILNLNCDRLNEQRLRILIHYNQQVAKSRRNHDRDYKSKLATRWFNKKWPSFFSTRRILLGKFAESYLNATSYDG
jgi:uncharacterized protein (TIGR02646 family)